MATLGRRAAQSSTDCHIRAHRTRGRRTWAPARARISHEGMRGGARLCGGLVEVLRHVVEAVLVAVVARQLALLVALEVAEVMDEAVALRLPDEERRGQILHEGVCQILHEGVRHIREGVRHVREGVRHVREG
eukprot:6540141-Prymnesium_polylepis.1